MDAVGESLDAGRDPQAKVGADVDVDEAGSERRCVPELVREEVDRAFEGLRMRPGEVHEVGRVDRHGPDVVLAQAFPEGGQLSPAARRVVSRPSGCR